MPKKSLKTIFMMVDNEFGVLTRITALVRREGFNIKSLAVSVTENPEVSRMLIAVECVDSALSKVLERLSRLDCVREAKEIREDYDLCEALRGVFQYFSQGSEAAV